MECLVGAGHDVNAKRRTGNWDGESALHLAARMGVMEAIKTLVRLGAKIDLKDDRGRTPLMTAVEACQMPQVVELLLDLGANVDIQDKMGMTALDHGAAVGSLELCRLLLRRTASPKVRTGRMNSSPIFHAVESGNLDILQLLIEAHADVDAQFAGDSPLSQAALHGKAACVKALLSAGANIEQRDEPPSGHTPILSAIAAGHLDIVKILIDAGANINVVNEFTGESALDAADKDVEIFNYLRGIGAKHARELPKAQVSEPGTFWQLPNDAFLTIEIDPWPPRAQMSNMKAEISKNEHSQPFAGVIFYRILQSQNNEAEWLPLTEAKEDEDGNVFYTTQISLGKGKNMIEFKIRPDGQKDFIFPQGLSVEVA